MLWNIDSTRACAMCHSQREATAIELWTWCLCKACPFAARMEVHESMTGLLARCGWFAAIETCWKSGTVCSVTIQYEFLCLI
jgi:hypothetical protein